MSKVQKANSLGGPLKQFTSGTTRLEQIRHALAVSHSLTGSAHLSARRALVWLIEWGRRWRVAARLESICMTMDSTPRQRDHLDLITPGPLPIISDEQQQLLPILHNVITGHRDFASESGYCRAALSRRQRRIISLSADHIYGVLAAHHNYIAAAAMTFVGRIAPNLYLRKLCVMARVTARMRTRERKRNRMLGWFNSRCGRALMGVWKLWFTAQWKMSFGRIWFPYCGQSE